MPKPASDEVALAGTDGRELNRLIQHAKDAGVEILTTLTDYAVERAVEAGNLLTRPLFDPDELNQLADAIAGVNATADLLGRARIREQAENADTPPFAKFADDLFAVKIQPPEEALRYFLSLFPSIGVDPLRFGEYQRRQAFTLAVSTNEVLTRRVQDAIYSALKNNTSGTLAVEDVLTEAGVSTRNRDYASMVFRTNAMDAYQTAAYEEARAPDLRSTFPVWQYLIVNDERVGSDHKPKGGRYYPSSATFNEVRGDRPFNCLAGDNFVQGGFLEASKAFYSGQMVEVRSASGCRISVTPNHPVLTPHGFIRAGDLKPGNDLIQYDGRNSILPHDHKQNPPTLIQDIFESFTVVFGRPILAPSTPLDFHGDGLSLRGDINVVSSNGELLQYGDFGRLQVVEDDRFLGRNMRNSLISSNSTILPDLARERPTVGETDQVGGLFLSPRLVESGDAKLSRFANSSQRHASLAKVIADKLTINVSLLGQRIDGLAGAVSVDKVIDVKTRHWDGPVYDMGTVEGFYIANTENPSCGLVVSNCRCSLKWLTAGQWERLQATGAEVETAW